MGGEERPRVDGEAGRVDQGRQPADEVSPVRVVPKDRAALEPSHHHVVEDPRSIEARLTGHFTQTLLQSRFRSNVPYYVPYYGDIGDEVRRQITSINPEPVGHRRWFLAARRPRRVFHQL